MTSTGKQFTVTREMLTAVALFVFHRLDSFLLYNKSLNAWSLGEQSLSVYCCIASFQCHDNNDNRVQYCLRGGRWYFKNQKSRKRFVKFQDSPSLDFQTAFLVSCSLHLSNILGVSMFCKTNKSLQVLICLFLKRTSARLALAFYILDVSSTQKL